MLVVNAHGAARSLAATVKGFAHFEPAVRIAGVIANHAGSRGTRPGWRSRSPPPNCRRCWARCPAAALPTLASRHLGLVTADQSGLDDETLDLLADAVHSIST